MTSQIPLQGYGGNKNIIIRNGTIEKACINMMGTIRML